VNPQKKSTTSRKPEGARPPADPHFEKFQQYFDLYDDAGKTRDKLLKGGCTLQNVGALLRNGLEERASSLYEGRRERGDRSITTLQNGVKTLTALADFYRREGQLKEAARMETEKSYAEELLVRADAKETYDTKRLGALHGKMLPLAPMVLAVVDDYIATKTGAHPTPKEMAHLAEAILYAYDRLPDDGVDPDLVAKKIKQFRERNPWLASQIAAHARRI
jgi:hypothetical protein